MSSRNDWPLIPGTVIAHSSAATGKYIGSPGLAILPDGSYVAAHDHFGPGSSEHGIAETWIYRSTDRGTSWSPSCQIDGAVWSNLFVHRGALFLFGTSRHYGYAVIRRSDDGGLTWTTPTDSKTGLLTNTPEYHCAPMPVVEHKGYLYRAFEHRSPGTGWGTNFTSGVFRAKSGANLLDARSWEQSNYLRSDGSWNNGDMKAWLEGNLTVSPSGQLVNMLRVQTASTQEKAAIITIDPKTFECDFKPESGFIPLPGGSKKFCIRRNDRTGMYYTISSAVFPDDNPIDAGSMRNCAVLMRSRDLRAWEIIRVLHYNPDVEHCGWQYIEWQFDGNDIVYASRTAFHDGFLQAKRAHDANFLTFHRIADFESASWLWRSISEYLPKPKVLHNRGVDVIGYGFDVRSFSNGIKPFTNRDYQLARVPEKLMMQKFTAMPGGQVAWIWLTATSDIRVVLMTSVMPSPETLTQLKASYVGEGPHYSDAGRTRLHIYETTLHRKETRFVPQLGWTGTAVISS